MSNYYIERNLQNFTEGKKLILFSLGQRTKEYIDKYLDSKTVAYILDNDVSKHDTYYKDIPVYAPEKLESEKAEDVVIIITSSAYNAIKKQLEGMRFGDACFSWVCLRPYLVIQDISDSRLYSTMKDGLLRIRITNKCNAKCRWCGQQFWSEEFQNMSLDPKVFYDYLKPLYEQIKMILLTGGDPLASKHSYDFVEFISKNYPEITVILETNGIGFNSKWQKLAADNLLTTWVSVNGSDEDNYSASCWEGKNGKKAFRKVQDNINSYIALLKERGLEVFAPAVSMVINHDNAANVRDFVKLALTQGASRCNFFFDYTESNMVLDFFTSPEIFRPVLHELIKIERVLYEKLFVSFRLWIPLKEVDLAQSEIEAIPLNELNDEYADLLELAQNRSMKGEYEKRRQLRKLHEKRQLTFDEDYNTTVKSTKIDNKTICASPFSLLDIYPDGAMECCSWIWPQRFNIKDFITDNTLDVDKLFNSMEMKMLRFDMLQDNYEICMKACPLNPMHHPITPYHEIWTSKTKL